MAVLALGTQMPQMVPPVTGTIKNTPSLASRHCLCWAPWGEVKLEWGKFGKVFRDIKIPRTPDGEMVSFYFKHESIAGRDKGKIDVLR